MYAKPETQVNTDQIMTSETAAAIKMQINNKAAGVHQITAELLKHSGTATTKVVTYRSFK